MSTIDKVLFCKTGVLQNNADKSLIVTQSLIKIVEQNLWWSSPLVRPLQTYHFTKKWIPWQVFLKDFAKIFRAPIFREHLITASVISFRILNITLVCRILHKCMLNIGNLNLLVSLHWSSLRNHVLTCKEIIIYKKRIYYFEEMFLKHLAMQFLEEFFLMVFWCTTISFFFAKVSEYFARLLMQITKTVQRFLKVHLVSSDFNHFSINVVFFPARINVICKK